MKPKSRTDRGNGWMPTPQPSSAKLAHNDLLSLIRHSALSPTDQKILFVIEGSQPKKGMTLAGLATAAGLKLPAARAAIGFLAGIGVLRCVKLGERVRFEIVRSALQVEPKNPAVVTDESDHGACDVVETEDGLQLKISFNQNPRPSKTGKLLELFSTQGFKCIHARFNDRPIVVSCYIGVKIQ